MKVRRASRWPRPPGGPVVFVCGLMLASAPVLAEISLERREALGYLLVQDCGSCHGLRLTGGLGPPLTAKALEGWSELAVQQVILGGVPGTPMPPWRGLLSEPDARWLASRLLAGAQPDTGKERTR